RIKAVATLFDGRKVEGRGVRHRLNEVRVAQISIGPGNCRMLSNRQSWDGLRKDEVWIKVRVMGAAAVPSPPTGVESELREICKPPFPARSCRCTAWQSAKRPQIHRSRAFGSEVGVEKCVMGDFIIGVVVDVYGHVFIQHLNGLGVSFIPSAARNFGILNAAEFVVLDPKVGLEYLCRRREPEQGGITGSDSDLVLLLIAKR